MALATQTYETKTDGKKVGPITISIAAVSALATVAVIILGAFGVVVPVEVVTPVLGLILGGIAFYSKGRLIIEREEVNTETPVHVVEDGTGSHRADRVADQNVPEVDPWQVLRDAQ